MVFKAIGKNVRIGKNLLVLPVPAGHLRSGVMVAVMSGHGAYIETTRQPVFKFKAAKTLNTKKCSGV